MSEIKFIPSPDKEDLRALHAALVEKRSKLNEMLWQTPIIAIAAQSFLLTIAFNKEEMEFYRVLSGLVATLIGLISWQLFLRHAALEKHASLELEAFEEKRFGMTVHARPNLLSAPYASCFACMPARIIWKCALLLLCLPGLCPVLHWAFKLLVRIAC